MNSLAAIVYAKGFAIDTLMAEVAARLRAEGLVVAGLVQHNRGDCADGCAAMALEEVGSGQRFAISLDRGAGASGCMLDPAGLAAAASALAGMLERGADCVIVNKFGKQEAMGRGLRDEIALALSHDLPVLTAVRADLLADFAAFAGEDWDLLPCEPDAIASWVAARLPLAA